jgi:hypothetical protein
MRVLKIFVSIVVLLVMFNMLRVYVLPPQIRHLDTLHEQLEYSQGIAFTINTYIIRNYLNHYAKRQYAASLEYAFIQFKEHLDSNPNSKIDVLGALIHVNLNYVDRYKKAQDYLDLLKETAQKYPSTPENEYFRKRYIHHIQAEIYGKTGKWEKAVKEYEYVIAHSKYEDIEDYHSLTLWPSIYRDLAYMYAYRTEDYDKALYYAKKMDIDPSTLPKEKIGKLIQPDLKSQAEQNHRESVRLQYQIATAFRKYQDVQQILVNDLICFEKKWGYIFNIDDNFRSLINERKFRDILVKYRPARINRSNGLAGKTNEIIPFSQYLEEQKKLYEQGKPSNYKWL